MRRQPISSVLPALGVVLALGGCQTAPLKEPATVLHCDNGEVVEVGYSGDLAFVTYKNTRHVMRSALSGTGARYVGDGLQWLTKGFGEGSIMPLPRGEGEPPPTPVSCRAGPPPP